MTCFSFKEVKDKVFPEGSDISVVFNHLNAARLFADTRFVKTLLDWV